MDGAAAQGQLSIAARSATGSIEFALATPADDAEIRALLRRSAMPGSVRLSLQREPDSSFAAGVEGEIHHTIVARESRSGRLIAMGSVAVRDAWINGAVRPLGYLGQLRLDERYRGQALILLRGYRLLGELRERLPAELYLTSIIGDNLPARRFLEAGLRGMPSYRHIGDFVTVIMPARPRGALPANVREATEEDLPAIAAILGRQGRRFQFCPHWTAGNLVSTDRARGLSPKEFLIAREGAEITGCVARWDQRAFKQAVVCGYSPRLARWRGLINLAAGAGLSLRLPEPGKTLSLAYLSHLAVADDRADVFHTLLTAAHVSAERRGIELLAAGFAADDPRLRWLPHGLNSIHYTSRLYVVFWENHRAAADALDGRVACPELALL